MAQYTWRDLDARSLDSPTAIAEEVNERGREIELLLNSLAVVKAGGGTVGKLPKWVATDELGDSLVSESGSQVVVSGTFVATVGLAVGTGMTPPSQAIRIKGSGGGEFWDIQTGTNTLTFKDWSGHNLLRLDGVADSASFGSYQVTMGTLRLEATVNPYIYFTWSSPAARSYYWEGVGDYARLYSSTMTDVVYQVNVTTGAHSFENYPVGDVASLRIGLPGAPSYLLQVHKNADSEAYAHFTNTFTGNNWSDGMVVGVSTSGHGYVWLREAANLYFGTSDLTRLSIAASGAFDFQSNPVSMGALTASALITAQFDSAEMIRLNRTANPNVDTNFSLQVSSSGGVGDDFLSLGANTVHAFRIYGDVGNDAVRVRSGGTTFYHNLSTSGSYLTVNDGTYTSQLYGAQLLFTRDGNNYIDANGATAANLTFRLGAAYDRFMFIDLGGVHAVRDGATSNFYVDSDTDNAYLLLRSNQDGLGGEESGIIFVDNSINKFELYKSAGNAFSLYDYGAPKTVFSYASAGTWYFYCDVSMQALTAVSATFTTTGAQPIIVQGDSTTNWYYSSIRSVNTGAGGRAYAFGARGTQWSLSDETAGLQRLALESDGGWKFYTAGANPGIHVDSTGSAFMWLDRASTAYYSDLYFRTAGAIDWEIYTTADAGSNLNIHSNTVGLVLQLQKASGWAGFQFNMSIPSGRAFYFDGGSNTYMTESPADYLQFVVGGTNVFVMDYNAGTPYTWSRGHHILDAGKRLHFDGSLGGNTYIYEASADRFEVVAGGSTGLAIETANAYNYRDIYIWTATPRLQMYQTDGLADEKRWDFFVSGSNLYGRTINDAWTLDEYWLQVTRSGYDVTALYLSANTIYFNGTVRFDASTWHGSDSNTRLFYSTGSTTYFGLVTAGSGYIWRDSTDAIDLMQLYEASGSLRLNHPNAYIDIQATTAGVGHRLSAENDTWLYLRDWLGAYSDFATGSLWVNTSIQGPSNIVSIYHAHPVSTISWDLGSATYRWRNLFVQDIYITGTSIINNLNADKVDSLHAASFLRADAAFTKNIADGVSRFAVNAGAGMSTASGNQASLECYQATIGADAFMAFHVSGDFAAYFGIDGGLNDFAVGGWSFGANVYRVWHAGNDGSGSGLDADTLDAVQGSNYARTDVQETFASSVIFNSWISGPTSAGYIPIYGDSGSSLPFIVYDTGNCRIGGTTLGFNNNWTTQLYYSGGQIYYDDGSTNDARLASVKEFTTSTATPTGDYPYGTLHFIY